MITVQLPLEHGPLQEDHYNYGADHPLLPPLIGKKVIFPYTSIPTFRRTFTSSDSRGFWKPQHVHGKHKTISGKDTSTTLFGPLGVSSQPHLRPDTAESESEIWKPHSAPPEGHGLRRCKSDGAIVDTRPLKAQRYNPPTTTFSYMPRTPTPFEDAFSTFFASEYYNRQERFFDSADPGITFPLHDPRMQCSPKLCTHIFKNNPLEKHLRIRCIKQNRWNRR